MMEMSLGHYAVIWIANGAIPIGIFLLFLIDHFIQWFIKWKKNGVI